MADSVRSGGVVSPMPVSHMPKPVSRMNVGGVWWLGRGFPDAEIVGAMAGDGCDTRNRPSTGAVWAPNLLHRNLSRNQAYCRVSLETLVVHILYTISLY